MLEEDLISGDGWLSDESSFYGDAEAQEHHLSRPGADPRAYLLSRSKDLNAILAEAKATPPDLHNIYEGQLDAWQLNESVDDFIQRLPPRATSLSIGPWIWVANPYTEGRANSGRSDILISRGTELLRRALQARSMICKENSQKSQAVVMRLLNQESENLKVQIGALAADTNVLAGKWMLFPDLDSLPRTWQLVVESTIHNRLGTAAKVATTNDDASRERLICIYTKNFRDTKDVLRVLKELEALGLVKTGRGVYYKADAYTYLDIYGKNASDYGLQASVYSSQKLLSSSIGSSKAALQNKQASLDAKLHESHDQVDTD